MTYKSLEEGISCTQTHQLEVESCTQTHQLEEASSTQILSGIFTLIVFGLLIICIPISLIKETPRTKFSIAEASIGQFNLTSNNTLYYNFKVTITAKNFKDKIESYDKVTVIVSYKSNQLASVKMTPFKISGKNIVRLQPIVFEGNNVMIFEAQQLAKYNKETQLEIYNLNLDLDLEFEYFRSHIHCPNLRVPLISNGKVARNFNVTTCWYKDDD